MRLSANVLAAVEHEFHSCSARSDIGRATSQFLRSGVWLPAVTVGRVVAGVACWGYVGGMSDSAVSEIHAAASEHDQLDAVRRVFADEGASARVVVGAEVVELPPSLVRLLAAGAGVLGDGDAVALVSEETELSPAEAARLLGVSRQYVDRLVADGVLPVRRLPQSRYRKIPARAVLAHRAAKDAKAAGIDSILEIADEAGLDY